MVVNCSRLWLEVRIEAPPHKQLSSQRSLRTSVHSGATALSIYRNINLTWSNYEANLLNLFILSLWRRQPVIEPWRFRFLSSWAQFIKPPQIDQVESSNTTKIMIACITFLKSNSWFASGANLLLFFTWTARSNINTNIAQTNILLSLHNFP